MRKLVLVLALLGVFGCGDDGVEEEFDSFVPRLDQGISVGCSSSNCSGCCTYETRECKPGNTVSYCGKGGYSCMNCCPSGYPKPLFGCRVCNNGKCESCTSHTQCSSDKICISGKCESPYGKVWDITVVSAELFKTGGYYLWDSNGTGPDSYVEIWVGGNKLATSKIISNSLSPSWSLTTSSTLNKTDAVKFILYDDDSIMSPPELIGRVEYSPNVPVSDLRKSSITWKSTNSATKLQELVFYFTPK